MFCIDCHVDCQRHVWYWFEPFTLHITWSADVESTLLCQSWLLWNRCVIFTSSSKSSLDVLYYVYFGTLKVIVTHSMRRLPTMMEIFKKQSGMALYKKKTKTANLYLRHKKKIAFAKYSASTNISIFVITKWRTGLLSFGICIKILLVHKCENNDIVWTFKQILA